MTHTATITANEPAEHRFGVTVTFTMLAGPSVGRRFTAVTDSTGSASFTYTIPTRPQPLATLPNAGADQIQASFFDGSTTIGSNYAGQGWSQAATGGPVAGLPPALVMTPGSTGFVRVKRTQDLPPGTTVDVSARRGISIRNYRDRRMTFFGLSDGVPSRFVLENGLRSNGLILVKLTGGDFKQCSGASRKLQVYDRAAKKKPGKPVRRLWGNGKGRYKTAGRYASATILGTIWVIADYCDGTLIKVWRGSVTVQDLVRHKTIRVTHGHAYFVKAS